LRNHAAQRVSKQVDPADLQRVEECDRVSGHLGNGDGDLAGGESDAGVVEQDHLPMCSDGVDEQGIPVVEVARKCCRKRSGGQRSSLVPNRR
jgi:hypothetical protein